MVNILRSRKALNARDSTVIMYVFDGKLIDFHANNLSDI